jgi:hypothetical protein
VAGKISWYQQLDFQSLPMEFSGGKLKQKGFFHSVWCIAPAVVVICVFFLSKHLFFYSECLFSEKRKIVKHVFNSFVTET